MPTYFTPPTDAEVPLAYQAPDAAMPCDPLMQRLMRFFASGRRGRNIFLMSDGTYKDSHVDGQPPNWNPADPTAPYLIVHNSIGQTTTTATQTPYISKVYWGGANNPLTAAEVTALTAAGYAAYLHS